MNVSWISSWKKVMRFDTLLCDSLRGHDRYVLGDTICHDFNGLLDTIIYVLNTNLDFMSVWSVHHEISHQCRDTCRLETLNTYVRIHSLRTNLICLGLGMMIYKNDYFFMFKMLLHTHACLSSPTLFYILIVLGQ